MVMVAVVNLEKSVDGNGDSGGGGDGGNER